MAAPAKRSGYREATRWHSSLQMADHAALVAKSPMWCAMKLARGEKIVRSMSRSSIFLSWLASMVSRRSSSLMESSLARGAAAGSPSASIWRLRQASSAFGAVV